MNYCYLIYLFAEKKAAAKKPDGVKKVKKAVTKKPKSDKPKAPKASKPKTVSKPKAPKAKKVASTQQLNSKTLVTLFTNSKYLCYMF